MDRDPNGEPFRIPPEERLNIFALVIYIPDPLGRFLDDLRRELVPHYNPHAHVSVLPPRPLSVDWSAASEQARGLTSAWAPFTVELTRMDVFPVTDVIYLEVGQGAAELRRMHEAMSTNCLAFEEPFPYHPHITLAQELRHEDMPEKHALALRRWKEYTGDRTFQAQRAAFVQNTVSGCWLDLAEYSFGAVPVTER